jgi:hypothetical protein
MRVEREVVVVVVVGGREREMVKAPEKSEGSKRTTRRVGSL